MVKKCFSFIDDVIFTFRDIARERPKSIFDNPFMKMLKKAHDLYGMKVQLNAFFRTDFFYGSDEFSLSEMPDCYKSEFEEASDWLKIAFHAKQEFPDYPYVNADYDDVKMDFDKFRKEVFRFAGEKSFAYSVIPHWNPISKDGCRALYDSGVKIISASAGERFAYNGDPASLPYGHAFRLLQNRKPETELYFRGGRNTAINSSICAYNHLPAELMEAMKKKLTAYKDEETGIYFKRFSYGPCLNLYQLDELEEGFSKAGFDGEYFGYGNHEEYFYSDYYAYQPDYADKVLKAAEIMHRNGYEYFFVEEIVNEEN